MLQRRTLTMLCGNVTLQQIPYKPDMVSSVSLKVSE